MKKLIALFVSVILLASVFSTIPAYANGGTATVKTNMSGWQALKGTVWDMDTFTTAAAGGILRSSSSVTSTDNWVWSMDIATATNTSASTSYRFLVKGMVIIMKPKILVVGSLVMDLIVTAERFCNSGESVIGKDFSTAPGGKGANQAVQAARLGADVTMVGKVGNDDFGRNLIDSAKASGVNADYIYVTDAAPTAVGNVQIQKNSEGTENRIIVVTGANNELTLENVAFLKDNISDYDMVILQHEIPQEINCAVAGFAKEKGVPVMLNPAPSAEVPKELISCLTYISPNEHEAEDIVGIKPDGEDSVLEAIKALHNMGVANVIITLGKVGCAYSDGITLASSPSIDIAPVVDPTAAGDSFIGAFCTAVSAGINLKAALVFANCTAGITVSRMGAQTSLPTLSEVISALEEKGYNTKPYYVLRDE